MKYFAVGQFRDTIPLFDGEIVIRFTAADFAGEVVTHCKYTKLLIYVVLLDGLILIFISRSFFAPRRFGNDGYFPY
jgi:hypothetical protein